MDPSQVNVALCYKNFAARQGISHIGLGVAMTNICKQLVANGITARVVPLSNPGVDLPAALARDPNITHVVVAAAWVPTAILSKLCDDYPDITFTMNIHSNIGFLQADANGIQLLREGIQLEAGKPNFHVAGNCAQFVESLIEGYGAPGTYLPNLYFLDNISQQSRPLWDGGTLRLGVFGATRWQKNFLTAVMAGIIVCRNTKAETELYINSARVDGPEVARIMSAAQNMARGIPNFRLVPVPWAPWPDFRQWVDSMHVLIQPSYTESFNLVTADGASRQVPSAVSPAIDWTPQSWQCDVDDAPELARVIVGLIKDPQAGRLGLQALQQHNAQGMQAWTRYLVNGQFGTGANQWLHAGVPLNYTLRAA